MIASISQKSNVWMITILVFSLMLLPAHTAWTEHGTKLEGEQFTDPSYRVKMPEGWEKQPIKYDDWAEKADLALSLDQHLYPALLPIIQKYAKDHDMKIAVKEGTCGISAGMLARKAVDIAGYCCAPASTDRLPGLEFHTAGIGALGIFVHPDNPIDNVTLDQAQQMYSGKIHRWSGLKNPAGQTGPDFPIQMVIRLHCKQRGGHWRSLLDNEDYFGPRVQLVGSIQDVILHVSSNPWALGGTETLYMAHHVYQQERLLKPLKINGYDPTNLEHLISGRYPPLFTYSLTTWENADPRAKELVDFLLQHVKDTDTKFSIVPVSSLRKGGWKFMGNEVIGRPEK